MYNLFKKNIKGAEMNIKDEERKDIILYNGLFTTSKVLLKNLHRQVITDKEYVEECRKLFDLWEQLKEQNNE